MTVETFDKIYRELKKLIINLEDLKATDIKFYTRIRGEFGRDERYYYVVINYKINGHDCEYEYKLENKEQRDIMEKVISWVIQ